jgi:serine protease Do
MKKIVLGIVLLLMVQLTVNAQEVVVINKNSKDTTQPLIVIDGVITPQAKMNDISPNEIRSMSVLKGTNATNKYGAKGENGVIEVITKQKAKTGKMDSVVNMTVVVDGDHVTINGVPADKNDPRITRRSKVMITKGNKPGETITVKGDSVTVSNIDVFEIDEDAEDMMAPPPPPPAPMNAAFLGVITESVEKGAMINSVSENSPAQKAGLKEDDIITKVNDKKIDGPNALYEVVGEFKPDDKINITYLREGKEKKTTAVLEKNKTITNKNTEIFISPNGNMPNMLRRGFRINPNQNFNFEMPDLPNLDGLTGNFNKKPKLGISIEDLESGEGVKVTSVNEASPADKAGFKANDIIVQFDDKKVADVNDLKWEYLSEGQTLKFTVKRGNEKKNIEVKIPKKLKTANL